MPLPEAMPIRLGRDRSPVAAYALALAASAAAVGVAALAQRFLGLRDLSLVFMLAVVLVAARTDTGPATLAALLSFLGYNFFFIEPRYSFYIEANHALITVFLFLAAAIIAGRMAARLSRQLDALQEAKRYAEARQSLSQRLALADDEDAVLEAARTAFVDALDAQVWSQLADPRSVSHGVAGHRTVEDQGWWFLPLNGPNGQLGTLGLRLAEGAPPLVETDRETARAMTADVVQALLRTRLAGALADERLAREAERTRSALLASVSHDLRTPLASIIGAAESLECFGDALAPEERAALLETVREEGQRLDRYIQNLLDMTRLGHGSMALHVDWNGIDELIGSAVERLQRTRPDARIEVSLPAALAPVRLHGALVEQAIYNLLDNATKFAGMAQPIHIEVLQSPDAIDVRVSDSGPGIAVDRRTRVFEMFDTDAGGDRKARGTGLGLAICKAIMEAHGGHVDVEDVPVGACLHLQLPTQLAKTGLEDDP
jgi:K+-sensing histidine kinase KdpD